MIGSFVTLNIEAVKKYVCREDISAYIRVYGNKIWKIKKIESRENDVFITFHDIMYHERLYLFNILSSLDIWLKSLEEI